MVIYAWEQRKYEDIGYSLSGGNLSYNDLNEDGINKCILYGELYTQYDTVIKDIVNRTNKFSRTIYKNDILFPQSTTVDALSLISPACMNEEKAETGGVFIIRPYKNIDGNFIAYYTKGNNQQRLKLSKKAQGLTIVHLYYQSIKDETLFAPKYEEQTQISQLLLKLDNLITLHQRKSDKFTKLTRASKKNLVFKNCMVKLPKITDAWEQRKLEDLANRYDNLRVPVSAINRVAGDIPYYGANGIQDYVDGYTHNGEFILVAEDGANDLKNYPVQYVNGYFWANNHTHVLQAKPTKANNLYLKYCISNTNIENLLVGGGRAKLNANVLMEIPINKPTNTDEQTQIGNLFYKIDTLITLHQRE